jgi:hypothetical protein
MRDPEAFDRRGPFVAIEFIMQRMYSLADCRWHHVYCNID